MVRAFRHYFSGPKARFFFAEAAAIALGGTAGALLLSLSLAQPASPPRWDQWLPALGLLAMALAGLFQFSCYLTDLYDLRVAREDRLRGVRLLRAGGAALAVLGLGAMPLFGWLPEGALMGGALGALAGSLAVRWGFQAVVRGPVRLLILGNGPRGREVSRALAAEGEGCFQVCAMVDPEQLSSPDSKAALSLREMAQTLEAELVVTAAEEPRGKVPALALLECRLAGVRVYDAAGFFERVLRRIPVGYLRASELAYSDELDLEWSRRFPRRVFDLAVALGLLVLSAPLMSLIACLIKLDSPGPVFYRQERVGKGGKVFRLWKFRSMRSDAEKDGAVWARPQDERITRVGRLIRRARIDEIPQVFNVLLGEMSFVGPRPERPVFVERLKGQIPFYAIREAVKPGITGWAQIRYPYGASVEDARNKLEYDLYYVKNGSLPLDLAIIFHTVRHVLLGRGAR